MKPEFNHPLPIDGVLPELRAELAARPAVVLQAPPGAGKTTKVPLALLDEAWLSGRSILILEPRRLAARAAAARMAELLGEAVGETVGFRIRFESKVSAKTRIEVVTEGILTRRLQSDPGLEGVGLVIFDEFHERHLATDLSLALCLDSRRVLREDLKILVMSATLDGAAVAAILDGAPVVKSEGRSFPVEIRYAAKDFRDANDRVSEAVAQAVRHALDKNSGDLLVFLPGAGDIRRTQTLLESIPSPGELEIAPLYGDLPWAAQDRAIRPGKKRKVVLATPIAETSLTIEGIGVVIDSGFVRVPQFDPRTGLTRLTTTRVSRASAEQRAGRAGRLGPGVCYRLWTEATQRGLIPQPTPEIRAADLAPLALELALWGAGADSLAWLDPPPAAALSQASDVLRQLGALDADGAITAEGRSMAGLPVHPRLAHLLIRAEKEKQADLGCDLAAILSERDLLSGAARKSCDLLERLEALAAFRMRGPAGARSHGADPSGCARVNQAADQYRRLLRRSKPTGSTDLESAGRLLALAYPDRVATQRSPGGIQYRLASGRGARLPREEHRLRPPALVAASLDAGETEGVIYLAAAVQPSEIQKALVDHLTKLETVAWDAKIGRLVAQREVRLGELILESSPIAKPDPELKRAAVLDGVRRLGLSALPWSNEARELQARVGSLRSWLPDENWPDVSDTALEVDLETWLGPFLDPVTRREDLTRLDLVGILGSRLDYKQSRRLDQAAPTHLTVPSGSRLRLEYRPGESPVLAVKLQEMFGLADTPRVADGKIPVTLHLLSPAKRPIQVTQDLKGFWERTYPEVKKELKGRYPKHPWPDDPWSAPPTARPTQRRG